jgi:integrase
MSGSSKRLRARTLSLTEWPQIDSQLWTAALQPADPLAEGKGGAALDWSKATLSVTASGYGRWLAWLQDSGYLDHAVAPADRATHEQVRAYHQMLVASGYAPYTVAGRIQQLADALRVMQPESDWKWVSRGASVIHGRARPRKSIRDRIRAPEEVLQLGFDLMATAENDSVCSPIDRAIQYRDGLAIAAMVLRPLRIKNFASIRIGKHLRPCTGGWRLEFERKEMKSRRDDLTSGWPDALVEPLARYLKVHRELLLDGAQDDGLWISKGGARMTTTILAYRFHKRTKDKWGKSINPHAFRHICGTTSATVSPANVTDVARLLGHATLETSEKYYTLANASAACARYQAVVRRKRKTRMEPPKDQPCLL